LDEKTKAYVDGAFTKQRDLKKAVNQQYTEKNNIISKTRQSLDKLKKLVNNKVIVICKSDKDGKLIILNMSDYQAIMERELVQFESLPLNSKTVNTHLDNIRHSCEKYVVELHRHRAISDKLLLHSVGMKENNVKRNFCPPVPIQAGNRTIMIPRERTNL